MFKHYASQERALDVGLACLEPIDDAARDHPDVAALVAALTRFATDSILVRDETRPWRPLLHHAFDRA